MRTKKWFLYLVLCFAFLFQGKQMVCASTYQIVIEDEANLLTDQEISDLKDVMTPLTQYGSVAFISITEDSYYDVMDCAEAIYYAHFGSDSGTLLLIDMDKREIVIHSAGSFHKVITNDYGYTITDNIYKYASRGEYYACAKEAFDEMNALFSGQKIAQPMKYISNFLLSILLAFLATYTVLRITSRTPKASTQDLVNATNYHCNLHNARALFRHSTKKYSPQSSGSSGGGSHGGGGGGGSHSSGGGGGHHSF